jgi:phosphate transport system permease protein
MLSRKIKELIASGTIKIAHIFIIAVAFFIVIVLFIKSWPILVSTPIQTLLFSSVWHPSNHQFGFFPFIFGSLAVTAIAMIISAPICLLAAMYMSEYAGKRLREWMRLLIDLMAGIPSVIFGLFGILTIVPLVSLTGKIFGISTTGYSLLAGGIILAIMVFPFITSVSLEIFLAIPIEAREASLALGTTKWETVRHILLKTASQGIVAAIVLGFARAFGETIAVMMVVGNVPTVASSLFDPVYPLPALIANNYGEMMSIPLYDSAMMFAALLLMLVVSGFSFASHLVLHRMERSFR